MQMVNINIFICYKVWYRVIYDVVKKLNNFDIIQYWRIGVVFFLERYEVDVFLNQIIIIFKFLLCLEYRIQGFEQER